MAAHDRAHGPAQYGTPMSATSSAVSVGSAHRWMCMAKWSAEASCREAVEDPILVTLPTLPTSEAGRTPEGGEHARRPGYGM
jgi:hypothetical protein